MKSRNIYWLIAGGVNLLTAFVHTIAGQMDLVNPLLASDLNMQAKTEWIGVWHMVTIILFSTSFILIKNGINKNQNIQYILVQYIGYLYIAFSVPFILVSISYSHLAPQWILLLPIGVFTAMGCRNQTSPKNQVI